MIKTNIENGEVSLSKGVFKDITSISVNKSEYFSPTKKDNSYINVSYDDNNLTLTLHLKVKKGIDIVDACSILQDDIHESIENMTSVEVKKINLDIIGFFD